MSCGSAFGAGAFGAAAFGSGSSTYPESARSTARNAVEVVFSDTVRAFDRASANDALNPDNWSLSVIEPFDATIRLAQAAVRVDAVTVRVLFDGPMDSGAVYAITPSSEILDTAGAPIASCSLSFDAPVAGRDVEGLEEERRARDLANAQAASDADGGPVGTYRIAPDGDFAIESGRRYLRKRIVRRATTALGGNFHLPGYGFAESAKGTYGETTLRRIQTEALRQVRLEPGVTDARVRVSELSPGVVRLEIRVSVSDGDRIKAEVGVDLRNLRG